MSSNASSGRGAGWWRGRGSARGRRSLRTGLTDAGSDRLALVGSSAMKTESYLSTTDDAGDGTIVTCACVDLGSSTRPEARRFIHDFQSRFGSPPGVFGAEGWDAGGMLLAAFRAGAQDRRTVAAALSTADGYEGLANTYRFDDDGELDPGSARVHVFRAEGVRWDPVGEGGRGGAAAGRNARLPVGRRVPEGPAVRLHGGGPPDGVRRRARRGDRSSARAHALVARSPLPDGAPRGVERDARRGPDPVRRGRAGHPHVGDRAEPAPRPRRLEASRPRRTAAAAASGAGRRRGRGALAGERRLGERRPARHGGGGAVHRRPAGRLRGRSWPGRSRPWPTSSRRRGVRSNGGVRSGSPRASTREPTTSSWPRGRTLASWRRSTSRSPG